MIKKEYKLGQEARDAILKTATQIGDMLGKTLGPAGRNFMTSQGITNDGRSILAHIRFPDECEDNVALAFHEVANRTDQDVGDGTTTATVIATELVKELIDKVPDLDTPIPGQQSVMELSRKLEEEKDRAIKLLSKKVIPVTTLEQLEQVAFTAMEDKTIAKQVAETIFKAGKDSFTALEEGFSGKIETSIQAGLEMPLQVAAPFMYNSDRQAIYEGMIPVLVVNHLFEEYRELGQFMQTMMIMVNDKKAQFPVLVIVAKQFSVPFVQAIARVYHGSQGQVRILLLSNAHLLDEAFEDIAAFCDAKYLDTHPKGGKKITDLVFADCGLITKIVATPKGAVFYGGKGTLLNLQAETTRVQARILEIKHQLEGEKDTTKRTALERRIAEFSGGKATIYVDAKTAAEKYYLKLKIQDCMNSCKTALEGGMVRGGGIALKEVADELSGPQNDSMEIHEAVKYTQSVPPLLASAFYAPYNRIQQNAGGNLNVGSEVMDSYLCVKSGIENAVSVVKVVISLEGIIADSPVSLVEELKNVINK